MKLINKIALTVSGIAVVMAAVLGTSITVTAQNRINAKGSTLYGYRAWSGTQKHDDLGWYELTPEGDAWLLWLDETDVTPPYFQSGWIRGDKLCGIYGNRSQAFHICYDVSNGVFGEIYEIMIEGDDMYKFMMTAAYNPDDDYVYGFSFNLDLSEDYLVKAPASDLNAVEIIRRMPSNYTLCPSVCFNTTDHHMYGVDFLGDLIRIDTNGNFELVATYGSSDTRKLADWACGMTYSPLENCFYWNRQLRSFESSWVRIDADTYEYTDVKELPIFDLYTVLECIDTDGTPDGPVRPVLKSNSYGLTAEGGKLTFVMPGKLANGEDAPATMTWTATDLKSGTKLEGTASAGDEVEIEFENLENGEHTIGFYATAGDNKGVSKTVNFWVGKDAPSRVSNIKIARATDGFQVNWDAVTTGTHKGYIDASDVSYSLYINDKKVGETKDCSMVIGAPEDRTLTEFCVTVTATADGLTSEGEKSNMIATGYANALPYVFEPTPEQMTGVTIINVDNDRSTWKPMKDFSGNQAYMCTSDASNVADDWLMLPEVYIEDVNATYSVVLDAAANSNTKTEEYLEVYVGNGPNTYMGEDLPVINRTNIRGTNYTELSGKFTVEEPGNYTVGIRCISKPGMSGVYVRNVRISESESGAVSNVRTEDKVFGETGFIAIIGFENTEAEIYRFDGRHVRTVNCDGTEKHVEVEAGFYVVKCGGKIFKTAVR